MENYTTSDCWGSTAVVTLEEFGTFDTKASSTIFPSSFTNNGTVRYSRDGSTDQQITDMDYHRLEISDDPDNSKIWDLGANRVIADTLKTNYDGNLVITSSTNYKVTVEGVLHISSGTIDNSDPQVILELADGVLIKRVVGSITAAPVFAGTVDIIYGSTSTNVTTGPELPTGTAILQKLELTGDEGVTLGADVTVNDSCLVSGSDIFTNGHTLTLGPSATLVEDDDKTVVGTVATTRTVSQSVNENFGGIGLEINAAGGAPGVTGVTRVTGSTVSIDGANEIERYFEISPASNSGLNATVVHHYDESELNGILEGELKLYNNAGGNWTSYSSTVDETENTVTATGLASFDTLTCAQTGIDYIASSTDGSWTDGSTWVGGVVPDSTDNVVIQSGDTVSVDNSNAMCRDISFTGNDANIDMNANSMLTVYGDFTIFSVDHCVFEAGWSATDAYIKFAGSAVQTLSGWDPGGGSTSFRDVIIDKSGGRVQTDGSDMRLGIQNSLEIVNGLFELEVGDDIEGRWASSGYFTGNPLPDITIQAGGELHMMDGSGAHHIRSDYDSGDHLPIGTVTVYGKATFRDASSYGINLSGVDIENGGKVVTSTAMGGGEFECGPLAIKAGGELENYTTSDCWGTSAVVTLQEFGTFDTKASSTIFPASFTNNGTVRYSREGTTDQEIVDMDYHRLEISLDPDNSKIWDLGADRVIADTLKTNYDGNLVITASSAHKVTVEEMLHMSTGSIDISDPEVTLELADGVLIKRVIGTITDAPLFAGTVDIIYASTSTNVTTGPELPSGTGILNDFELTGDEGLTLGADVTVNGTCTASGSDIFTDAYKLTLGASANLVESDSITVVGEVTTTRTVSRAVNETFGEIGLEINAACIAPGVTTVTRITGSSLDIAGSSSIERYFEISPVENIGLDATVIAHYDHSELGGISETVLEAYSRYGSGGDWFGGDAVVDEVANTVTATGLNSLGTLTVGPDGIVTDVQEDEGLPEVTRLVSVYPNPFNPATRIRFDLSRKGPVSIVVYDVSGRAVRTLKEGTMDVGRHELTWNGINTAGGNVSSGVYFCRMVTEGTSQTIKMVLLR
ncbi:MAG: T9SS type A sorting domain-containing protein [Candidatus Latescibacteria bacterium]|nr:T9SS type A sorting domain-containing protein [bacterium]MBD3424124.1 T9SS type A sorting domain-containing protein [Candidatus Latescibacterota bacterium]